MYQDLCRTLERLVNGSAYFGKVSDELDFTAVRHVNMLLNDPTGRRSFHPLLFFAVRGQ